jgi:hypothetical protein
MKPLALIAALSLPTTASAVCETIVLHLASRHTHVDMIPDLNERNLGVGCRIERFEFGVYLNSVGKSSAYAMHDMTMANGFGVFVGLATGYDEPITWNGITPIGGLIYKGDIVTLRVLPMATDDLTVWGAAIGLSIALPTQYPNS